MSPHVRQSFCTPWFGGIVGKIGETCFGDFQRHGRECGDVRGPKPSYGSLASPLLTRLPPPERRFPKVIPSKYEAYLSVTPLFLHGTFRFGACPKRILLFSLFHQKKNPLTFVFLSDATVQRDIVRVSIVTFTLVTSIFQFLTP